MDKIEVFGRLTSKEEIEHVFLYNRNFNVVKSVFCKNKSVFLRIKDHYNRVGALVVLTLKGFFLKLKTKNCEIIFKNSIHEKKYQSNPSNYVVIGGL